MDCAQTHRFYSNVPFVILPLDNKPASVLSLEHWFM